MLIGILLVPGSVLHALESSFCRGLSDSLTRSTNLTREYLTARRVVWVSDSIGKQVKNVSAILRPGNGQSDLNKGQYLTLIGDGRCNPGLILDFGREIQGGIQIITTGHHKKGQRKVRIRFGESVAETMSDICENGATNDHAMRDFEIRLPWLGSIEIGHSGFRFVRVDLLSEGEQIEIKEISAVSLFRDIPYLGSFRSNDQRLNEIWMTGAYTVHLNMQDYLWDGIKRDRLVWVGDMHPEVMTINAVFGHNEVVPMSLDLARNLTPLPNWMNGISSYSMWWVLIHRDWFYYQGDIDYLKQQKDYLISLLQHLSAQIGVNGEEKLDGRFLDWPSKENDNAIHAGLQSLMMMTFNAGSELCRVLGEQEAVRLCLSSVEKLKQTVPGMAGSKQAAALLAMSGLISPKKANDEILSRDGVHKMSTFYGYYMLKARAMAGDCQGAIDNIREYWGAMLDLGATTFWEDFDIEWTKNAGRIDEVVPAGRVDVHGLYGNYCYKSYRHSLCHGWASGPTAWLTEYVLGIKVVKPGCRVIKIEPNLGDLSWVEGSFPTPYGLLEVKHVKTANGKIKTTFKGPKEVKIIF